MDQPKNKDKVNLKPVGARKPEDFNRWENEGGNPDPRFIAAKNEVQGPKIVAILRNLFLNWKSQYSNH